MAGIDFTICGAALTARGSGALWWPEAGTLVVSDLHLAKSERMARRGGALLPPFETRDTLMRLEAEVAALDPSRVICLGDSFDDDAGARALHVADAEAIRRMQSGRDWIWIAGNHDPDAGFGGRAADEVRLGPLTLRHIAQPEACGEVSGHYHPKARLSLGGRHLSRPCFLIDAARLILPAFGTYTGGLDWTAPALSALMGPDACAVLVGQTPHVLPLPRRRRRA